MLAILGATSCTKEEEQYRQIVYGGSLEREMQAIIRWHAYEMMVEINDTIWPPGKDGNPIRMRDPNNLDKWLYIAIKTSEVTIQEQKGKITFKALEELGKEKDRTVEIFRSYPEEIIEFIAPENMKVMSFTDENFFSSITNELNIIRQRLVDKPGNTMSQEVTIIHNQFEKMWIRTCTEAFIDEFLNPSYNRNFKNN